MKKLDLKKFQDNELQRTDFFKGGGTYGMTIIVTALNEPRKRPDGSTSDTGADGMESDEHLDTPQN